MIKRLLKMVLIAVFWPLLAQGEPSFRATYTLSFDAAWSATSHPQQFPPNPHFSGLIGATHSPSGWLWRTGEQATQGIESMAELGSTSNLRQEIQTLIEAGVAESVVSGAGISSAPGSTSLSFELSQHFPLLSVTSMIAPSPDWFVGVDSLSLRQGGRWVEDLVVDLQVYDAGTDSGTTFTANNADTNPAEPIVQIGRGPLVNGIPIGTFRFQLQSVRDYFPIGGSQSGVYYDADRNGEGFYVVVGSVGDRLVFSVTWFTYLDGRQMWLVGSVDLEPGADVAVVDMLETAGADFGEAFDPADVLPSNWGTATFRFPGCGVLEVDYDGGIEQGHLELESLLQIAAQ